MSNDNAAAPGVDGLMPALVVAALMSWVGWVWLPFPSTAWVLAELPAAIFLAGLLWRDRPLAMSAYFARIATAPAAPTSPPTPRAREDAPVREDIYVRTEQADVAAPVADLDSYRERRAA